MNDKNLIALSAYMNEARLPRWVWVLFALEDLKNYLGQEGVVGASQVLESTTQRLKVIILEESSDDQGGRA
ncbi:MAG: hypothetical protein AAF667_19730 [Pseudomonadota bacterium]